MFSNEQQYVTCYRTAAMENMYEPHGQPSLFVMIPPSRAPRKLPKFCANIANAIMTPCSWWKNMSKIYKPSL